ncbi:unnamed protein product [Penicillium camemberti]|uniref:Str. FM013 n=1 Tax=Penicillium camemberti (strain FM 013) TaxID=1429867 RepID=A0A0G4P0C9_PENC3|nr:unnamed protein product [Penicillium camemberti]
MCTSSFFFGLALVPKTLALMVTPDGKHQAGLCEACGNVEGLD